MPLQVIFCHCKCPQGVLALQQLPRAGSRVPATEHTEDSDLKPATLSVCPNPSVCGILGRFPQAAASRPASSQEFLVQCCSHPASPGHPVTTVTLPASGRG